jgi:hypothetical protein
MGHRCFRRCLLRARRRYALNRLRERARLAARSLPPDLALIMAAHSMDRRDYCGALFYVLIALGASLLVALILLLVF